MSRTRVLPLVTALLVLSPMAGTATAKASAAAPYCYEEPSQPTADVSDLKAKFTSSNWMPTLQAMYQRRWPSGQALAIAQAKDKYWDQFVQKNSFEAFAESMMVAIHEETHMWDLDPSRTRWNVHTAAWINAARQDTTVPLYDGFPARRSCR